MHSIKNKGKINSKEKSKIKVKDIKTEEDDLQPMSTYIDDRVDLIKHIFSTLKPKTIRNLAPDFLKKSSIEEIEELCLSEILGISNKRLLSIINATKCPTDTDSSSDSDVQRIEDHISLEEISSDSEEEVKKTTKAKKADRKRKKLKTQKASVENENNDDKEISVLELLELQARARAIRSQLALEPVTKIEVDSNESDNDEKYEQKSSKIISSSANSTTRNEVTESNVAMPTVTASTSMNGNTQDSSRNSTKRIKLKRNFRFHPENNEDSKNTNSPSKNDKISEDINEKISDLKENKTVPIKNQTENNLKEEEEEACSSPDLITVLQTPETFFISDSSDEENEKKENSVSLQQSPKHDHTKSVEKEIQSEKQIISKSPSPAKSVNSIDDIIITEKTKDREVSNDVSEDNNDTNIDEKSSEKKDDKNESDQNKEKIIENEKEQNQEEQEEYNIDKENKDTTKSFYECKNDENQHDDVISLGGNDLDYEIKDLEENIQDKESEITLKTTDEDFSKSTSSLSENKRKSHTKTAVSGSDNDDKEEKEEEKTKIEKKKQKSLKSKEDEPMDYIELHDSSDEQLEETPNVEENSQSWNERWLRSKKVTNILAQSRLSNRIRDKIKKQNKQVEEKIVKEKEEKVTETQETDKFQSKYEDGSVQQYKEILERK